MITTKEKQLLKDCVDLMWRCYQEIAHTPEDDHWSRIAMQAKDLHQSILNEGIEYAISNLSEIQTENESRH
jgi:hypothetical protein